MAKYRTRQRDALLSYLISAPGAHVTAADVCDYFRSQGSPIGQSTVYRQLESLVADGLVKKYFTGAHSPACFEYIAGIDQDSACFHFKCEKCGRLIHLQCGELAGMQTHLLERHQLSLDPARTVFYGLCDRCS